MCGIAGIYLKPSNEVTVDDGELEKLTDALLIGIEPRGDHATGIATMDINGDITLEKSDTPASNFIFWRSYLNDGLRKIILHTRWATQGSPTNLLNNHPVQYENAYVVHNGHINNDDELFESEGFNRIAKVDSEIIAAVLNHSGLDDEDAVRNSLEKLTGGFAIAAFDARNKDRLLLAKGEGSPLVLFENSQMFVWASTETAIKDAMEYALGYEIKRSEVTSFITGEGYFIEGGEKERFRFNSAYRNYSYGGYQGGSAGAYQNNSQSNAGYSSRTWDGVSKTLCDGCYKLTPSKEITKKDGEDYCEKCLGIYMDFEEEINDSRGQKVRESVTEAEMDAFNDEHWAVCELVGDKNGCGADFVDFMLFGEDEEKIKLDDNLLQIFTKLSDDYDEVMDELVTKFSFRSDEDEKKNEEDDDGEIETKHVVSVKVIDAEMAQMI
jgi:hypothetical protein